MASINYATREISCKIVYYGPGLSGKTTNLQIIHRKIPDKDKSEMVSLATETDRTLFFDFLPLDLGSIKGFNTKFQLYTVPGQVYYNATRKLVLRGVDGVVFVVDSQVDKLQENLESFANLQENLREYGHSIENIPLVLQYNKRDLPNVYPIDQLNALVNKNNLPYCEAVAATGVGVFTTLKAIGKSVIDKFNAKYAGFQGTRRPTRPDAPVAPAPTPPPAPKPSPAIPGLGAFGNPSYIPGPVAQPFPQRSAQGGFGGGFPTPPPVGFGSHLGPQPGFTSPPPTPHIPPPTTPSPFGTNTPNPFATPGAGLANIGPGNPPSFGNQPKPGFPTGFPPVGQPPAASAPSAPAPSAPAPFGAGPTGPGLGQGSGIPTAFPFQGNKPGFPPAGNPGFPAAPGIPVSPFVESFTGSKPAGPAGQGPGGQGPGGQGPGGQGPAGPLPIAPHQTNNPFSGGVGMPAGFGQNKPSSPLPSLGTSGGGFASPFSGNLGNLAGPQMPPQVSPDPVRPDPVRPGPMGQMGQNPAPGFGAPPGPFGGGFGSPGSAGFTNPPAGFGNSASSGFGTPTSGGFGPPGGFPPSDGFGQAGPGGPGPGGPGPGVQGPGVQGPGGSGLGGPGLGGLAPGPGARSAGGQPGFGTSFPPSPGRGGPPYPTLSIPTAPGSDPNAANPPPPPRPLGPVQDNSGIVSTYEDMAKDDSFKTKKLPHPNEKKKGFFDGLFKKDK